MSAKPALLGSRRTGRRKKGRRLSHLLRDLAADHRGARVSVGDLCDTFPDRAFGALIFIFAAPNVLPIPIPGISALTALPLLFLTAQLTQGRPIPWPPRWIRDRSFALADFRAMIDRVEPFLIGSSAILRPRLPGLLRRPIERGMAVIGLVLAVILFLPIPLGNILPGLAVALFGLAIL